MSNVQPPPLVRTATDRKMEVPPESKGEERSQGLIADLVKKAVDRTAESGVQVSRRLALFERCFRTMTETGQLDLGDAPTEEIRLLESVSDILFDCAQERCRNASAQRASIPLSEHMAVRDGALDTKHQSPAAAVSRLIAEEARRTELFLSWRDAIEQDNRVLNLRVLENVAALGELEKFLSWYTPRKGTIQLVKLPDWLADVSPIADALVRIGAPVRMQMPHTTVKELNLRGLGALDVTIEGDATRRRGLLVKADELSRVHGLGHRSSIRRVGGYEEATVHCEDLALQGVRGAGDVRAAFDKFMTEAGEYGLLPSTSNGRALLESMFVQTVSSAHGRSANAARVDMHTGATVRELSGYSPQGLVLDLRKFPAGSMQESGLNNPTPGSKHDPADDDFAAGYGAAQGPTLSDLFRKWVEKASGGHELNGVRLPAYVNSLAPGVAALLANTRTRAYIEVGPPPGGLKGINLLGLDPRVQVQVRDCLSRRAPWVLRVPEGAKVVPSSDSPSETTLLVARGIDGVPRETRTYPLDTLVRFPNGLLAREHTGKGAKDIPLNAALPPAARDGKSSADRPDGLEDRKSGPPSGAWRIGPSGIEEEILEEPVEPVELPRARPVGPGAAKAARISGPREVDGKHAPRFRQKCEDYLGLSLNRWDGAIYVVQNKKARDRNEAEKRVDAFQKALARKGRHRIVPENPSRAGTPPIQAEALKTVLGGFRWAVSPSLGSAIDEYIRSPVTAFSGNDAAWITKRIQSELVFHAFPDGWEPPPWTPEGTPPLPVPDTVRSAA